MTRLLTDTNARAHAAFDDSYLDLLEAFTACDYSAALAVFHDLNSQLQAHLEFEESQLLPLLADGQPGMVRLISSDHLIIERLLKSITIVLAELINTRPPRRSMLCHLPLMVRLGAVLEHHTEREQQTLYPLLDEHLPDDNVHTLANQLAQATSFLSGVMT